MMKLIIFIVSFFCTLNLVDCACTFTDESDGSVYSNLGEMTQPDGTAWQITDNSGNKYWFNVCGSETSGDALCGEANVAVCQLASGNGEWTDCGSSTDMTFSQSTYGAAAGVTLTYGQGTDKFGCTNNPRKTFVDLICNPEVPGKGQATKSIEGQAACTYEIQIESANACPDGGAGGSGSGAGGWIFIGIVLGGFFLYCVIGSAVNFKVKGLSGKEMIPQSEFWFDLPNLLKDGALFTKDKLLGLCGKGSDGKGSYSVVG